MASLKNNIRAAGKNYIAPFLWLHNEDDALIVRELHRIHDCGIGAVCIESRTHKEFCRDDWWSDVRLILDTCKELGMKLWILDDIHFPSGNANGIFEHKYAHLQQKNIRQRHMDFAGPVIGGCVMVDEHKALPEDEIVGIAAMRRTEDGQRFDGTVVDLTDTYKGGRVYFDLPEGLWTLTVMSVTKADVGSPFYCDKLTPEATDAYIEEVYEPHYAHFAEDFGDTLLGFFADEPAFHNNKNRRTLPGDRFAAHPWHKNVYDKLCALWGKDTVKQLTRIWFDFTDGTTEPVRETYMDVITALYRDCFCGRIGDWCERHGVMYIGHIIEDMGLHKMTGAGPGHYFRSLEGQHMSGVDVVLHQILPGLTEVSNTGYVSYQQMDNRLNNYLLAKLGSSAAHIEPKKQGRAMCEIFGAFGWAEDTVLMKYLTDHFLVRGTNYFVPHAFSPKENDTDCPPNFYNTGKNPQYKYFRLLMEYMNRACAVTDGATHIPTCAVIYDAEATWTGAEYTDNKDICKLLCDAQLDYDIIPWDRIDDIDADGNINGEHYPVILLPYSAYLSESNRKKSERLADRVVCIGERPIDGFTFVPMDELVSYMEKHRDISLSDTARYVRYSHYEKDGVQCYFLSNEDVNRTVTTTVRLRGFEGGDYVLWDQFENTVVRRHSVDGSIPLTLAPYNMLVLLIGDTTEVGDIPLIFEAAVGNVAELAPTWKIELCREQELPNYTLWKTTDTLENVTGHDALPDFTGNMRYTAKIELSCGKRVVLDLGEVGQTAEVKLNGKPVGVRIYPPYRFDVTEAVRNGENELEVVVANTCTFEQRDNFSKFLLIKPSGLLGPIRMITES
ncbi:MAG: hypothetical protein IJ428_06845 [Clostridia bacterium]|nr:hypothetical protein [Clostridia bacterium]